mmetsp:Transcript_35910/g.73796  ORF Transcript_35910/g.73796 Transcript_35910/m.73796 type:complete len:233 (+) Transcript_35910:325-1023(+)
MPMISAGTPTTFEPRKTARTLTPWRSASDRRMRTTAEAPSETCEAFPAVVEPPFLKTGLSLASFSKVEPSRGPSSLVITISFSFPSASSTVTLTGTISRSKRPSFWARSAFMCDSTAKRSCTSRETPYFSATFSEVTPMALNCSLAMGCWKASDMFIGGSDDGSPGAPPLVIDSTPPPMPASIDPHLMAWAIWVTASSPEAHWRLVTRKGTSWDKPARICATRPPKTYEPIV